MLRIETGACNGTVETRTSTNRKRTCLRRQLRCKDAPHDIKNVAYNPNADKVEIDAAARLDQVRLVYLAEA